MAITGINVMAQEKKEVSEKKEVQEKKEVKPTHCPSLYITTSTGLNNNTGILGFSLDVPVGKHISLDAGPGIGSWGFKLYAGAKYYLDSCQRGWAFGTGITYSTGVSNLHQNLPTVDGNTEAVILNENAQANILFAAYKYWTLGKRYNRFYLELGWSVKVTSCDKFNQISGTPITSDAASVINLIAPGGPIAAVGLSFGVQ